MKPSPHFIDRNSGRNSFGPVRGISLPRTDHNFQAGSFGDSSGRCGGQRRPSFRGISDDYFRTEARRYFKFEAAIFGLILVTAAVPVIQGISGLVRFVYGML